jgi:hypothetical protein
MNRLASAVALALLFSIGSCGDDEKTTTVDAGADTGTAGDGPAVTACTGSFMGVNSAQLAGAIAMSTGPKSCQNDVALVCTGNIATIAGQCGLGCVGKPRDCITTCIKGQLATLSDACTGCYADTVTCAQTNCLQPCLGGTSSDACVQCQITAGCRSAFATCSGLPTGAAPGDGGAPAGDGGATDGGTAGDGGATDAPGADGGAADTAVASDTAVSSDTSTD